ncbi:MAG TPA: YkgJ family cysteine cluster protein [Acidobacteriota bacterium]|nr:YkgJ family cysteine cluster protein [Acidobacteriota bacterium]HQM61893.1 YkgJ family cysteine cluster protein [Acidobacteriota bacterium]
MTNWFTWYDLAVPVVLALALGGGFVAAERWPPLRAAYYRSIRWLLAPVVAMSGLLTRWERRLRPPRWKLSGGCNRCGECCELLAVSITPSLARHPAAVRFVQRFHEVNYEFVYEGYEAGKGLLFGCPHLGPDRLCRIYDRRPRLCREYPSAYAAFPPDLPSACGFRLEE